MPKSRPPYPLEYRRRIVELAGSGRRISALAREFGVTANSIRSWRKQADLDAGRRSDGLTSDEREELNRPRRELAAQRLHSRSRPAVATRNGEALASPAARNIQVRS